MTNSVYTSDALDSALMGLHFKKKKNLGITLGAQSSDLMIQSLNWTGQDSREHTFWDPLLRFLRFSHWITTLFYSPGSCSIKLVCPLPQVVYSGLCWTGDKGPEAWWCTLPLLCRVLPLVPAGRFLSGRRPELCQGCFQAIYGWILFPSPALSSLAQLA